jgi:hypothetical protein
MSRLCHLTETTQSRESFLYDFATSSSPHSSHSSACRRYSEIGRHSSFCSHSCGTSSLLNAVNTTTFAPTWTGSMRSDDCGGSTVLAATSDEYDCVCTAREWVRFRQVLVLTATAMRLSDVGEMIRQMHFDSSLFRPGGLLCDLAEKILEMRKSSTG